MACVKESLCELGFCKLGFWLAKTVSQAGKRWPSFPCLRLDRVAPYDLLDHLRSEVVVKPAKPAAVVD